MASCNEDFNNYRLFLEKMVKYNVLEDQSWMMKLMRKQRVCRADKDAEIIHCVLMFLEANNCPIKLISPTLRNVQIEIKADKSLDVFGHNAINSRITKIVLSVLRNFFGRLTDNVDLNKILDTSHLTQQQLNDDFLTIPIRAVGQDQNKRRTMEDRHICIDEFHKIFGLEDKHKSSFYGVFDGHGSHLAAEYSSAQLPYEYSLALHDCFDPVSGFERAYENTDLKYMSLEEVGGTTAVCALYRPEERRLIITWAGDSKAMLVKQQGKIMQLVTPHIPTLQKERDRIRGLGGYCKTRVCGVLGITRAIGDARYKRLVISRPDCVLVELDKQEEFLVMATDGLWDHATEANIAKTVYDCIKEDCENLAQIPSRLISLAKDGDSTDNISVVVLFFRHPSQIAKNCDNLTIMDSEFDNVKDEGYFNSGRYYASEGNTTSNSCAIEDPPLKTHWSEVANDNLNNIIHEEVIETSPTTNTTTTPTNNGLYSNDDIELNQKITKLCDDNNMHHASTLENNDEELVACGYDNKTEFSIGFDNDQQKILEKNLPHHQQLGDTDADYGPETCVDVTDDVVMMTENSADTNNLLEQSTLSHSKDTIPSSDNCNPFDNKNALDMEDANEYQLGSVGFDAHLQLDDANKATPLLSPEVEDLPLSSECGLQYTNEGFQQSPLDEIPVEIGQGHSEFDVEFMQSNGHFSPEKLEAPHKMEEEEEEQNNSAANFEMFADFEEKKVQKNEINDEVEAIQQQQQTDLDDDFLGSLGEPPVFENMENSFENVSNDCDFRSKDEEEILEKHVDVNLSAKGLHVPESEVLDLNQREELQKTLHNHEDDVLEEKPILTGYFAEINFDASTQPDEESLSEFAEEKQDKEKFSEKEDKVEELFFLEGKSASVGEIALEEDDCIHLEEDVRPSDYLAMLERQEQEHEQLCKVVEGFEREAEPGEKVVQTEHENVERIDEEDEGISVSVKPEEHDEVESDQLEKPLLEEIDVLSHKDETGFEENETEDERLSKKEEERHADDEKLFEQQEQDETEQLEQEQQQEADKKLDEKVVQIDEAEHYDVDESLSFETEKLEQERHLGDIEIMSQQFDRFEKEDQADYRLNDQPLVGDENSEPGQNGQFEELQNEPQQVPDEFKLHEMEDQTSSQQKTEDNKFRSDAAEEQSPLEEDMIIQPEKQCFEEPEKSFHEAIDKLVLQHDQPSYFDHDLPIEETENKLNEDSFEETEKQLVECTEKQLSMIEQQVLGTAPAPIKQVDTNIKSVQEDEVDPENMVEVEEEIIIKEQVPIKPSALPVSSQEPSIVPPTHESCDESEDNEWKYIKEGQGEKQLLGLPGDIAVEEELQQQLQQAGALTFDAKLQPSATSSDPIPAAASNPVESIKDTFNSLTQQIAEVAELAVDKIGDTLESLNISQSSTQEKLDNFDNEDLLAEMNSKLNPEAKEFVPTFPPPGSAEVEVELANGFAAAPTAIPHHFKDELLAQSPRKGRESNMENINIPAENEFEEEIAHKPHGLPGDEAIIDPVENGGLYQDLSWKEATHGSEKEEGPLIDSPVTEESLEVVENIQQYNATQHFPEFTAPSDLDNAGMKESIYIENNSSMQSNEEDVLNTVQVLPVDENESKDNSFDGLSDSKPELISLEAEKDAVTKEEVDEILTLASDEKKESELEEEIQQKMEQLLLTHDKEMTKNVDLEAQEVHINGVELTPTTPGVELIPTNVTDPIIDIPLELPSAPVELSSSPVPVTDDILEGLSLGAAAAVAVAATTAAVKKVEAEKNQKNLSKTSSATKSKVPDVKKAVASTTTKTSTVPSVAAKRKLSDKPKPATVSSLATKKTVGSTTTTTQRPRTAPAAGAVKTSTERKTTTTTSSTAKSRVDTRPPLTARKPLSSSVAKTTTNKPTNDAKSSSTTVKSSIGSKSTLGSKTSVGSARTTSTTNAITKPRPATAPSVATTNGTALKTAITKPTTLAPKSAAPIKALKTSPRGTLTSTLRKTEAIKSPTKPTSSTITSRLGTTNGTKTTTSTRTSTTKSTLSTVPTASPRSTTTTTSTTRRSLTGTSPTVGATTPTSKTNNLVPRKSTPLKKTTSTPPVRKSLGSKLNASATKPTKDTTTPRPVTIPAQHQHHNSIAAAARAETKDIVPLELNVVANGEPKLNGIASPDDVSSPTVPVASHQVEMEIA